MSRDCNWDWDGLCFRFPSRLLIMLLCFRVRTRTHVRFINSDIDIPDIYVFLRPILCPGLWFAICKLSCVYSTPIKIKTQRAVDSNVFYQSPKNELV